MRASAVYTPRARRARVIAYCTFNRDMHNTARVLARVVVSHDEDARAAL